MDQDFDARMAAIRAAQQEAGLIDADPMSELADAATVLVDQGAAPLVGKLPKLLIVAGGENYRAASAAAPPDTIVAGIQSAREWIDVNGGPHAELDRFIVRGTTEAYLYMGDFESSFEAHVEAEKLARHLGTLGARGAVRHFSTGAAQLSEVLGARPTGTAMAYLGALMGNSGKLGRRPAAPKASPRTTVQIAPVVDVDNGVTYIAGAGAEKIVIMSAAAFRVRTYRIFDDLKDVRGENAQFTHDICVTWMKDGILQEREVTNVPDAQLATPRKWLNRVPGGTGLHMASGPGVLKDIESAVRAHDMDLVPEIPVYRRTGWVDLPGEGWSFLHPDGAMTRNGNTRRAKAKIGAVFSCITIKDTAGADEGTEREAARTAVAMMDALSDLNIWVALWGIAMHTVAGLGVGAVAGLFGGNGSGKTVVLQGVEAYLSADFGPDRRQMALMDDSPKKIASLGTALDGLWIYFDDKRKGESRKLAEQQAEALEYIIRPGYAGGSGGRSTMVKSDDSETGWEPGMPSLSSPARGLVGEEIPDGDKQNSSRERMYPAEIPKGFNIFTTGNASNWKDLAHGPMPQWHLAFFIRWVAEQITDAGGKEQWEERWKAKRTEFVTKRAHLGVSIRVREVGSVPETGMAIWLTYLHAAGVITTPQLSERLAAVDAVVTRTVLEHGTQNVNTQAPLHELILNSLRAAVIGGSVTIERLTRTVRPPFGTQTKKDDSEGSGRRDVNTIADRLPYQTFLGIERKGRGDTGWFIALQPRDVLNVLRQEAQFRELTERELFKAFAGISLTDPGKSYKTVTVKSLQTRTLAISTALWMPGVEVEEIPPSP